MLQKFNNGNVKYAFTDTKIEIILTRNCKTLSPKQALKQLIETQE